MSLRYTGAWMQDGAFNPLTAPTPSYTYNLYMWGRNNNGQLGLGNTTNYSSPKQIGSLTDWIQASAGGYNGFTLAIKKDNTLWAWGINNYGQLGSSNTSNYSSPKQIGSLTNWLIVSASYQSSAAIKTDGSLWVWGYNALGQLGLGNTTNYSSPKQVGALTNWIFVSGGYYHKAAVKSDGTLWTWGSNAQYQLGNGNATNYSSPKQVGALTNWATVTCGNYYTMAIKTDGTLWAVGGSNYWGNFGLGTSGNYISSPVQVGALTTWASVDAGTSISAAIRTDKTLWTMGYNASGQLGQGNTTNLSSPKQVGSLTNWANVSCGSSFMIANKTDGTLWTWGYNAYGQLGLGNTTNYSSPKQVGSLTTWGAPSRGLSFSHIAVLQY